jgi:hypothetical protein
MCESHVYLVYIVGVDEHATRRALVVDAEHYMPDALAAVHVATPRRHDAPLCVLHLQQLLTIGRRQAGSSSEVRVGEHKRCLCVRGKHRRSWCSESAVDRDRYRIHARNDCRVHFRGWNTV